MALLTARTAEPAGVFWCPDSSKQFRWLGRGLGLGAAGRLQPRLQVGMKSAGLILARTPEIGHDERGN